MRAKVYGILTAQLVLSALVGGTLSGSQGLAMFLFSHPSVQLLGTVLPLGLLIPLYVYRQSHPLNLALLACWTASISLGVGLACSLYPAAVVVQVRQLARRYSLLSKAAVMAHRFESYADLPAEAECLLPQALVLCAAITAGLTSYTFWAVRRGVEFDFMGPFLCSMLWGLLAFCCLSFFVRIGGFAQLAMAGFGAMLFSAYIVYDTHLLIKRFSLDDYVWASVTLYLDILNLFVRLLEILGSNSRGE